MKNSKIYRFFATIYQKLFKINDTPQRIALGMGIGVFSGIIPGTGPLAALFLAFLLKVNRAAALIGSLLTNTWLSIVIFFLAIKLGSAILGVSWQEVYRQWQNFTRHLDWNLFFKLSVSRVILPVMLGYIAIGLAMGLLAYAATLIIVKRVKHANKS